MIQTHNDSFWIALIRSNYEILIIFGYLDGITVVQNSKTDNFGPVNLHTQTYKFSPEKLMVYLLLKEHENDIKNIKQRRRQGNYLQINRGLHKKSCVCAASGMIAKEIRLQC